MKRSVSPTSDRRSPALSETGCRSGIKRENSASRSPVITLFVNISFIMCITSELLRLLVTVYSSSDVHEDRFRLVPIHALADARQEHPDGVVGIFVVTVEIKAVGRLRAACELGHEASELCDIFEWSEFVVEVMSGHVQRRAARLL